MNSYQRISSEAGVRVRPPATQQSVLDSFSVDGAFDPKLFKTITLARSQQAAGRELATRHLLESLSDGDKAIFSVVNYLGGTYYLTADEVFEDNGKIVIQESKNCSATSLPSVGDIKDGLFKLILFGNMSELKRDDERFDFAVRLKLTGPFRGKLTLPSDESTRIEFVRASGLRKSAEKRIHQLHQEAEMNENLTILLAGHDA